MVQQGLDCCIPIKQCMYLITKGIDQSMEYSLVFMAYVMRCLVIPLLGNKGRLPLDPPNEKGKLELDVIFASYFGCKIDRGSSFQEWISCQFVVTDYNCGKSLSPCSFWGNGGFCWKTYVYFLELNVSLIYKRRLFILGGARLKGIPEFGDLVLHNGMLLYPEVFT